MKFLFLLWIWKVKQEKDSVSKFLYNKNACLPQIVSALIQSDKSALKLI